MAIKYIIIYEEDLIINKYDKYFVRRVDKELNKLVLKFEKNCKGLFL